MTAKRLICTFVLAGAMSVVAQLLMLGWGHVLGAGSPFVGPAALACFSVFGFLIALTGKVGPMMGVTVMGVIMPTCGMVMGVAEMTRAKMVETGDVHRALAAGSYVPLLALGGGTVLAVGLCLVVHALPFPVPHVAAGAALSAGVGIVLAFVVGGLIATVAEVLLVVTGMEAPKLMLCIILAGAVIAIFDIPALQVFSNAGFSSCVMSVGQGAYDTFELLLGGHGPLMFAVMLLVFAWVSALAFAAGLIRARIEMRGATAATRQAAAEAGE